MDESNLFSFQSKLPPKRKTLSKAEFDETAASVLPQNERTTDQDKVAGLEDELSPELLAELEQALKPEESELVVNISESISARTNESSVSAPILEDYIDPHTVPINYLLQQARAQLLPEDLEEMNEVDKNEK